jgi:hypothetical protein
MPIVRFRVVREPKPGSNGFPRHLDGHPGDETAYDVIQNDRNQLQFPFASIVPRATAGVRAAESRSGCPCPTIARPEKVGLRNSAHCGSVGQPRMTA